MTADQIQRAKTQAYQFRAVGTVGTTAAAAAPAQVSPAPAVPAPSIQPPAPPVLQPQQSPASSTAPPRQPAATAPAGTVAQAPTPLEVEAKKHMNQENVDRLMKNVPPQYRKRFGF
jgi:hypothetical protein